MEGMVMINNEFWRGKRVFITGHTGFKGGWLSLWLQHLGAKVYGYSLEPPTETNLFKVARVAENMKSSTIADIRNTDLLKQSIANAEPEIVFHLAAQPLVRYSYDEPVETYSVNVMGTISLLEAVRATKNIRAVVIVTSDKCYENREWLWGYRENEAMGGYDPYSSSKGCAELVTAAWRKSFFESENIAMASARAGNVIGGGDWASDRLVPDFLRALDAGHTLKVRSPDAVRPWQHVLEPIYGYLLLSERLYTDGNAFAEGWNFGSNEESARPVRWIIERLISSIPGASWQYDKSQKPHEANYLKLDSSKAHSRLCWKPRWNLESALERTVEWHLKWRRGEDMLKFTMSQISKYEQSPDVF